MNGSPHPHTLSISYTQAQRLIQYIQFYRSFAWENMEPTAERNAVLRALQAIHGMIMSKMDQSKEGIILPLLPDERLAMKMMVWSLLGQYEGRPATKEQTIIMADLTGLRTFLDSEPLSSS